jgi:signal transduction histidine kinase
MYASGGIVTDVTERRRLEEEIVRISEHEQERIAQDLHDGLGQQLAGTWFLSDTLRKALAAQDSSELPMASKIARLLETAVSQIRSLAHGLSPVSPQPNGLMVALEALAPQCSELFAVDCRFFCPEPVLIEDNRVATHLYRIAQEAISNAVRHGKAKNIELELFATKGHIVLRVTDNGIGFRKTANQSKGMGLRTMNYRADVVGADFAIKKRPGRGTVVMCSLRTHPEAELNGNDKSNHK